MGSIAVSTLRVRSNRRHPASVLVRGLSVALLAAVSLAASGHPAAAQPPTLRVPPAPQPAPGQLASPLRSGLQYLGVSSCSASNCHGGPANGRIQGSECTIWMRDDAHARAFSVLYNEQSQRIARNLGIEAAHEAQVCLNCHGLDATTAVIAQDEQHILADGVSCEMCHGPASAWLEPHRRAEWQNPTIWPQDRKEELGFRDTKDVLLRSQACAGCHVGAPGRDVNHDLIAAGHPRLAFEFSAYHAMMPAHWSRREDLERHGPALEAKAWAVGQATAVEAAARLLAWRAENQENPWPEFAEYSCAACHHALETPSWRQDPNRTFAGGRPGQPAWSTWQLAGTPSLLRHPAIDGTDFTAVRRDLAEALEKFPAARREPAAARANALAERLGEWAVRLNEADYSAPAVQRLMGELAANPAGITDEWDAATQLYLAVVAVNQARVLAEGGPAAPPSPDDAAVYGELREIRDLLAFPAGTDSPGQYDPDAAQRVADHLSRVRQLVEGR
jgi:hypothetical protein